MTENVDYYAAALAGKAPPISPDHPQAGRYRMRACKGGPYLPVIIHTPKGQTELAALIGPRAQAKTRPAVEVWTYCGDKPVTKEAFTAAFETGIWPGDAPDAPQPAAGDNSGDLSLAEQIHEYAARAIEWLRKGGIKDATSKDTAANMRAKLLEFRKRADSEREAKKRPHLEASREVDAAYKPLIEDADAAANQLRDALTVYMRQEETELRAKQEAERKVEAERIAAENKRIAEERAKLKRDDPIAAYTSPEPEQLSLAPAEPVKVQAGGQRGRKTGLRTVTKYVVRDYAAALEHCKDHPRVREAVETVACAQAKTGASVPGVETVVEKVAA